MLKRKLVIAVLAPVLLVVALVADGPASAPREAEAVDTVTTVRWGPYTAPGFGDFSQFLGDRSRGGLVSQGHQTLEFLRLQLSQLLN